MGNRATSRKKVANGYAPIVTLFNTNNKINRGIIGSLAEPIIFHGVDGMPKKGRKWWYEAFLEGYKPATLHLRTSKEFEQLKKYPYIHPFNKHHSEGCIFFQNEAKKQAYQKRIENVEEDSYQWHYIVGNTLGFPRKSVEWFSRMSELEDQIGEQPEEKKLYQIGVHWGGFFFSSNIDFVVDEVKWLWSTYTHPKAIGNPLYFGVPEKEDYEEIAYKDFDRLVAFREYIRSKRGLTPMIAK